MKNKGFTLVELLVASGIFSMLVVTIVGVFTSSIKLQDSVLSTKTVIGEANYVMEFLSRNLRMATKDKLGVCLSTFPANYELLANNEGIKFRNIMKAGECQSVYLDPAENRIVLDRAGVPSFLTSPTIEILKLEFTVSGDQVGDGLQPMVTIYLEAKSGRSPAIKLQTSISQRNLDADS